ncbi:3'(2'),5'-bisphosphate nucleotidase CysQ [Parvularcula flava]|uniref:3'(2'),5'-bisphosphate nucleotidase CysQ n=1 Tax=Aquisalinus luteolus TaxID=1566827 RepID=A0A8J3A1H7_9PROT|nr:3'(2'),5'-bisphosphate nucleotidase CysQ [Aquisalinus luteolus]NHK26681.1 3'(2'),5'-bisphosphate nucleotidase CysQ [Aquisalinus luteolus]GGH93081.1 3'(2'),5'-bisphosphate nucleotidase CysQ [Aquisalinus luteolus]
MAERFPGLAADRQAMREAVREAGAAVLALFGGSIDAWTKADSSPISEADLAANRILKAHLIDRHDGGYGWLSEESTEEHGRLDAPRTWVIDPIDGTRAFLKGRPHFTICAALIEEGDAIAAAVFNPATREFFEAERGAGATLNGAPIGASGHAVVEDCAMLGAEHMFRHPGWPEDWPQMRIDQRNSTNYRMALVAKGEFDATLALARKADWDAAPGALIAEEAGAIVSDHLGEKFTYNKPDPRQRSLVCAAPALYEHVLKRLAHLPPDFTSGSN